jgi:hypothetical protein
VFYWLLAFNFNGGTACFSFNGPWLQIATAALAVNCDGRGRWWPPQLATHYPDARCATATAHCAPAWLLQASY